ncbi:hypothetical protein GW17_00029982, partial [Ensete ventricosum]
GRRAHGGVNSLPAPAPPFRSAPLCPIAGVAWERNGKMQQWRSESSAMTFDEVSMERSKTFVKALQDPLGASKPSTSKSFGSPSKLEIYRPHSRSKSMLSAFFTKNKTFKTRKVSVS